MPPVVRKGRRLFKEALKKALTLARAVTRPARRWIQRDSAVRWQRRSDRNPPPLMLDVLLDSPPTPEVESWLAHQSLPIRTVRLDRGERPAAPFMFFPTTDCSWLPPSALDHAVMALASCEASFAVLQFGHDPHGLLHPRAEKDDVQEHWVHDLIVFRVTAPRSEDGRLQIDFTPPPGTVARLLRFPHRFDASARTAPLNEVFRRLQPVDGWLVAPNQTGRYRATLRAVERFHGCDQPDERPTILVLQPFLAMGGAETLTVEVLRRLVDRFRFVVITTDRHRPELNTTIDAYEEVTPFVYLLDQIVPPEAITNLVLALIRRFDARALFVANGAGWFYDQVGILRRYAPDLAVVAQVYDHRVGPIERYHEALCELIDIHIAPNRPILKTYTNTLGIPESRCRLIHHGIDPSRFDRRRLPSDLRSRVRERLGVPDDRLLVAFIARLHSQKRPLDFLDLAARFREDPRFHFALVGDGPLRREVEHRLAELNLSNLTQLPFQRPVEELLCAIDLLCLTSAYEGLPLILLETLSLGIPAISTDVGCVREVLDKAGGVVIDRIGDIDAFARALDEYGSKEALAALSTHAREVVERDYNINVVAEQYGAALSEAMFTNR